MKIQLEKLNEDRVSDIVFINKDEKDIQNFDTEVPKDLRVKDQEKEKIEKLC